MTALLWLEMMNLLRRRYQITEIGLHLLLQLEKKAIKQTDGWLRETQSP
jgi:hypothetical protein